MSVPKRFDVLRFFSGLLKVLAWINLVIAILAAIGIAIAGGQAGTFLSLAGDQYAPLASTVAGAGGIFLAIFVLLGGLFYFVLLYALGRDDRASDRHRGEYPLDGGAAAQDAPGQLGRHAAGLSRCICE